MKYSRHPLSNLPPRILALLSVFFLVLGLNVVVAAASSNERTTYTPVESEFSARDIVATEDSLPSHVADKAKKKKDDQPKESEPETTATPAPAPTPVPSNPPSSTPPAQSSGGPVTVSASSGYGFVNDLRAANGKSSIARDGTLESSAAAYAKHLAKGCKDLIHSDLSKLLGIKISGGTTNSAAENLAFNESVGAALNGLKNSPGHFANMIGPYTHIGIGAVRATDAGCKDTIYLVMQFVNV